MGLLGDIGGAVGGYLGGQKESKFIKKATKKQQEAIKAMLALQQSGMDVSAEFFQQSEDQLNAVGPAMRQELLKQGNQAVAGAEASALSTGLAGTSAMAGMRRGVLADTNQNLSQLQEGLATERARLYERRGSEVYQQYIDRANISQRTKYDPFLQNFQFGQIASAGAQAGGAIGNVGDSAWSAFTTGNMG